jgi:beta-galactosidase
VGGFPGLCLDNPEVKELTENFHAKLIEHYRNHPALLGYDLLRRPMSAGVGAIL